MSAAPESVRRRVRLARAFGLTPAQVGELTVAEAAEWSEQLEAEARERRMSRAAGQGR